MASKRNDRSFFSSANVQWNSQPVVFHNTHGRNIELSQNNTVATRVNTWDYGVVFTSESVSVGQMLKVVISRKVKWTFGGLVSVLVTDMCVAVCMCMHLPSL